MPAKRTAQRTGEDQRIGRVANGAPVWAIRRPRSPSFPCGAVPVQDHELVDVASRLGCVLPTAQALAADSAATLSRPMVFARPDALSAMPAAATQTMRATALFMQAIPSPAGDRHRRHPQCARAAAPASPGCYAVVSCAQR